MASRNKMVTITISERQAELACIALLHEICEIQDNPKKEWMNNSQEQADRRAAYDIIDSVLPRGYQREED